MKKMSTLVASLAALGAIGLGAAGTAAAAPTDKQVINRATAVLVQSKPTSLTSTFTASPLRRLITLEDGGGVGRNAFDGGGGVGRNAFDGGGGVGRNALDGGGGVVDCCLGVGRNALDGGGGVG